MQLADLKGGFEDNTGQPHEPLTLSIYMTVDKWEELYPVIMHAVLNQDKRQKVSFEAPNPFP